MTRKALHFILLGSLLGACSGKIDLGNGPGDGAASEGASSSSQPGGGSSGFNTGGSSSTGPSGGVTVGVDEAGVSIGPNGEAGIGGFLEGGSTTTFADGGVVGFGEAGSTTGSVDGGLTPCGGGECGPGESCVATVFVGGPPCIGDGGCPPPTPSYVCQITPPSCAGDLRCGCAASLCHKSAGCLCGGVKDNVLSCTCEVP